MRCDTALPAISAAADGELDDAAVTELGDHLRGCAACTAFDHSISRVRAQLRFESLDRVPSLPGPEIATEPGPWPDPRSFAISGMRRNRKRSGGHGRVLSQFLEIRYVAAAAAAVGMVVGATFAGLGRDPQPPAAADLPARVLAAQHDISSLDVEFSLTEHGLAGWDGGNGSRDFDGRVRYVGPESLTLTLSETEPRTQPAEGDVSLVVDEDEWSLDAVRSCSSCPGGVTVSHQTISGREPFSDAAAIPLELVTAVDSFALAAPLPQLGDRSIAGHSAIGVRVTAAQVAPYLDALSPADDLRAVYPTDRVDVWFDRDHLVPLAVEVRADGNPERTRWASTQGYLDAPGDTVLGYEVHTIRINAEPLTDHIDEDPPRLLSATPADSDARRQVRDDGFRAGDPTVVPVPGTLPVGQRAHTAGTVTTPTGPAVGVRSWTDGRAWVKVRATEDWDQTRLFGDLGPVVRTVDLGEAGHGYVSADGRKVALHTDRLDVVVTGSLSSDQLRALAASLGVVGEPIPPAWPESATATLDEARAAQPALLTPSRPEGFAAPAVRVEAGVVTQVYAGPGDRGFVLTQSTAPDLSPPSDGDSLGVQVRGLPGRYSVERGELEWTEDDMSFSLSSPTLSLPELVALARDLVP